MFVSYRQVEDENVGGVPHGLVEEDHEDDKEVADEANDDDEGEDDGDDDGDYGGQGHEVEEALVMARVGQVALLRFHGCN